MPHETETQSNASLIGDNATASFQDTGPYLASNESVQNGDRASAMPETVFYGNNDFNEDFMAQLPTKQLPESSLGDLISDAGYSLKSTDKADERPPDPSLDLTGFGTQFDAEHGQSTGLIHNLEDWIRKRRVASAEPRTLFLPIDQLERCMTAENIKLQLRHAGVHEDVNKLSDSLVKRGRDSRQRIFAILCMIELSAQIGAFIREGIYDTDLPFIFKDNKVYSEVTEGSERQLKARLALKPAVWRTMYCEAFEKHQGEISPPIFKFTWAANEKVLHFSLKDELVLPFMEVKEASQEGAVDEDTEWEGGTSFVRKVKIHAAHYNAHTDAAEKNDAYFAVKELKVVNDSKKRRGYKEDREAVALKRFHDKSHPHLIRLLATYTYRNHFNLIFPWADGNLKEFWETGCPDLGIARRDPNIVKWVSAQILGLSKALKLIHYCEIDDTNRQGLTADELKKLHGRHGDLKPENILWFKDQKSVPEQAVTGVLQIGDLGFADFHSKKSRSLVRRSAVNGVTETYSAPEFDVTRQVSPQFDIWSFGCILLQFVVWYMYGWHGIEDFSSERIKDSKILIFPSDNFYSLEGGGANGYKGRAKRSVVEMFKRLKWEASNDYILDLVECIETDLLRVDNAKRAKIGGIVDTLTRLDHCCQEAETYCTSRTKPASRTDSGLSEIVELPEFAGVATQGSSHGLPTKGDFGAGSFKTFSKDTTPPEREVANSTNGEVMPSEESASTVVHVANIETVAHAPSTSLEDSLGSAELMESTTPALADRIAKLDSSSSTHESSPALNGRIQQAHTIFELNKSTPSQDKATTLDPKNNTSLGHLSPTNSIVPRNETLPETSQTQFGNEPIAIAPARKRDRFRARCRRMLSRGADLFLGKREALLPRN